MKQHYIESVFDDEGADSETEQADRKTGKSIR